MKNPSKNMLSVKNPLSSSEWALMDTAIAFMVAAEEGIADGNLQVESSEWGDAEKLRERGIFRFVGNGNNDMTSGEVTYKLYALTDLGQATYRFFNEAMRWSG